MFRGIGDAATSLGKWLDSLFQEDWLTSQRIYPELDRIFSDEKLPEALTNHISDIDAYPVKLELPPGLTSEQNDSYRIVLNGEYSLAYRIDWDQKLVQQVYERECARREARSKVITEAQKIEKDMSRIRGDTARKAVLAAASLAARSTTQQLIDALGLQFFSLDIDYYNREVTGVSVELVSACGYKVTVDYGSPGRRFAVGLHGDRSARVNVSDFSP